MPLVVGAIAMVIITTLKNDQGIQGTVADSSAATLASSYYVRDIESAGSVTTTPALLPRTVQCGRAVRIDHLPPGLQLQGTTPTATVSYYTVDPGARSCPRAGAGILHQRVIDPQSHEILSDNLSSTNPPTPIVGCISPTPTSIPTGVTCSTGHRAGRPRTWCRTSPST